MNRETLLEKGFSEEQVTEILNTFHNQNNEMKKQLEEANKQVESYKKVEEEKANLQKQLDAINEANLTEQEKLAKEKQEIEKNLKESRVIKNTAKAKDILAGLDIDDALISTLVSEDEEKTLNNANLLKTKLENVKNSAITTTKEQLANLDVKPNPSNSQDGVMTWDKYTKLSQEEQSRFATEHPEEFANL